MSVDDNLMKASIAEFIGTFTLVFIGAAAVVVAPAFGVVVPALAHGLILCGIIFSYGYISGAHVNPAVTAGLLVGRQIKIDRAIYYWIAQFLGGIVAAFAVRALIPDSALPSLGIDTFNFGQTTGSLTADAPWTAAGFEFVLTYFLVSVVYQSAVFGKVGHLAALAIGLTLSASILAGGAFTGASLNPARTLGPALAAGDLSYILPYFVGIFGGGIFAGLLHSFIFKPEEEKLDTVA
jgi:MIP family channel proteins